MSQLRVYRERQHFNKRTLPYLLGRRVKWIFGDRSPLLAYLKVTKRCNLDCYYCPWHTRANDFSEELETERWKTLIADVYSSGARVLVFEGGEPTLRSDLPVLLDYARSLGALTILATNGIGEIWRYPAHAYTVSLDGPPTVHDSIRGKGTFKRVIENLEQKTGQTVVAITVISRRNHEHIEELLSAVSPWIDAFLFTFLYPYGVVSELPLSENEVSEAKERLMRLRKRFRILNPVSRLAAATNSKPCHDSITVSINHRGEARQGCFVDHVEPKKCDGCDLSCFQFLSAIHEFNFDAWFSLLRLLKQI